MFVRIARSAQHLKVAQFIRSAFSDRMDMVNLQFATSAAVGALSSAPLAQKSEIIGRDLPRRATHPRLAAEILKAVKFCLAFRILPRPFFAIGHELGFVGFSPAKLIGRILLRIGNTPRPRAGSIGRLHFVIDGIAGRPLSALSSLCGFQFGMFGMANNAGVAGNVSSLDMPSAARAARDVVEQSLFLSFLSTDRLHVRISSKFCGVIQ